MNYKHLAYGNRAKMKMRYISPGYKWDETDIPYTCSPWKFFVIASWADKTVRKCQEWPMMPVLVSSQWFTDLKPFIISSLMGP